MRTFGLYCLSIIIAVLAEVIWELTDGKWEVLEVACLAVSLFLWLLVVARVFHAIGVK